jgi:HTH-type transcriptional regulator / antitoxin HipB
MTTDATDYRRKTYRVGDGPNLAKLLRALRAGRGFTQTELGALLGVTKSRVSAIETEPGVVSVNQLLAILDRLDAKLVIEVGDGPRGAVAERPLNGGEW